MAESRAQSSVLDRIGRTPLVPLARMARGLAQPVLAKCEHLNPGGSVKDRIALSIVHDAEKRGRLPPGGTIVEATAGNTGVGLALVAAVRGYKLVCVMPTKMSADKRVALAAMGARVVVTPDAPDDSEDNFRRVAARMARENGWFLADQFENPANPRVHAETTGPEIVADTGGHIGAFVAGVGTGGTLTGVGRCLRACSPHTRIVLADPIGSGLSRWVRERQVGAPSAYRVEGIGASSVPVNFDAAVVDEAYEISDDESFATTLRLVREEGLLVGGSSGTAVAAALKVAARRDLRGPVVVLLADSWDRYQSQPWLRAWAEVAQ